MELLEIYACDNLPPERHGICCVYLTEKLHYFCDCGAISFKDSKTSVCNHVFKFIMSHFVFSDTLTKERRKLEVDYFDFYKRKSLRDVYEAIDPKLKCDWREASAAIGESS